VPVPSLFFIGENGTPLEIVAGNTTATELASKIDNVLLKAGKINKEFSSSLIDAEKKVAATSSSSNNNAIEATTSNISNIETNSDTDLITITEPVIISSINDEKSLVEEAATASSSTENQNNNEASINDTEITQENQNVELTAEVCEL